MFAATSSAQSTARVASRSGHRVVVKLVERPGTKTPFAFEPAEFQAERGDTIRFVQATTTMHNVHFLSMPAGARLGGAAISPYLTNVGDEYDVVVDSRFTAGRYEIVCDPHQTIGMHGFLTVTAK